MSEQQDRAEALEQQYVQEYGETEDLVAGLDPDRPDAERTTEQVKGVAEGGRAEEQVDEMAREDP